MSTRARNKIMSCRHAYIVYDRNDILDIIVKSVLINDISHRLFTVDNRTASLHNNKLNWDRLFDVNNGTVIDRIEHVFTEILAAMKIEKLRPY